MKEIEVAPLETDEEYTEFVEWMSPNTTEPEKLGYPGMRVLRASNGKSVQYAMIHPVAVIEHIASNPDAGRLERTLAAIAIYERVREACEADGIAEIYCSTLDRKVGNLLEHGGFERVTFEVWRKIINESQPTEKEA